MIHSELDIEATDNGDLVLQDGDFKMATSARSIMQAATFIILTDYGEYMPAPLAAGNLGSFIGQLNNKSTHIKMRSSVQLGLDFQDLIDTSDVAISIVPVSIDTAMVMLKMPLVFVEKDENDILTEPLILGFIFPYESGTVEQLALPNTT